MKILKKALIVLAVIVAIPLVAALFIKRDYAIEREIVIDKPVEEVFDYIKYLKNQDNYSKWSMMDPNMKKEYRGEDGRVGFVSAWESEDENVGVGEQEILKIVEGEKIETKLRFKVPFEAEDDAYMSTEAISANQTKVKWVFSGSFPYPFNIMKLFFDMEEAVGGDLEVGLQNLKSIMETGKISP
ncbi:MAG: SRPBCC family protein [Flavobacteriales bacterium]